METEGKHFGLEISFTFRLFKISLLFFIILDLQKLQK